MPDPILANQPPIIPPPTFPEMNDIPPAPQEASEPINIPPMIAGSPSPKRRSGKIIATILGIFLLVSAVGAGVVLVGQKQLFQQKAALAEPCKACVNGQCQTIASPPNCTSTENECSTNSQCAAPPSCISDGVCLVSGQSCCNGSHYDNNCSIQVRCGGGTPTSPPTSPPTTPPACTGTDSCIPDHENTLCEQVGGQWQRCTHYVGDKGYRCDLCNGVKAGDTSGQCAVANHYCIPGGFCITNTTCEYRATSCTPDPSCATETTPPTTPTPTPTGGPTSTPSPTLPPAACYAVKAYDTNWNLLTGVQLSALSAGDIVRFTISGTPADQIDKARFTINGVLGPEVTAKKPGTDEYYTEYTIPAGVSSFTVTAQIHHLTLGWF